MTLQHHLPADIERTSISIITRELDELGLTPPPETAAVVKRVIHTTADFDYAKNLRFTPGAVQAAVRALQTGAVIVTDTNMALAGISRPGLAKLGCEAVCYMADPAVAEAAKQAATTRAVAAMHRAAREHPGAILGGKQGDPLCNLRTARRACHCCHGAQGRQQCGRSHLQRPCLFCRRNAGPLCQRVERIKERPTDRFLRKQRQCRIDKGSPCLTNRKGLFVIQKGYCTLFAVQQPLKK